MGHLAAVAAAAACTFTWHAVPSPPLWGAELRAVAATAADDAWAVGGPASRGKWTRPVIEHWNGKRWTVAATPPVPTGRLDDVAAVGRADAWAAGDDLLLHWDGVRWHRVFVRWSGPFTSVSAAASDDVWITGPGVVAQWDGTRWRLRLRTAGMADVTALAANDVWVAAGAVELHWDGNRWTRYTQRLAKPVWGVAVSASGPDDVWVAGNIDNGDGPAWPGTMLFHWAGKQWRRVQPPPKVFLVVNDLLAPAPGELWLAAYRANGDAYGGGAREQLHGAHWQETDTGRFVVTGLAADRAGGMWGVGVAGSYPNGLGFPTVDRPLIERAGC